MCGKSDIGNTPLEIIMDNNKNNIPKRSPYGVQRNTGRWLIDYKLNEYSTNLLPLILTS